MNTGLSQSGVAEDLAAALQMYRGWRNGEAAHGATFDLLPMQYSRWLLRMTR